MRPFSISIFLSLIISACAFSTEKPIEDDFRVYDDNTFSQVKNTYYENHTKQTLDFVLKKKQKYEALTQAKLGIWEVIKLLDEFVDESDPDINLPQSYHAFQTAEALRKDGHPRWLILTGFIHDLGKILYYFGEPQWAVVGDTFPLGCQFSSECVFPEYFKDNPDYNNPKHNSKLGIYSPHCGFDKLVMSYGHDEYLYHVMKKYLPKEALYIIRFHSFYPAHKHGAYQDFMNEQDHELMPFLKLFCKYDLYSKTSEKINVDEILPYYEELVSEFLPDKIRW